MSSTFASVGALVPDGFEGYARVLHPALNEASQLVKWSTVAEWSGRVYHPLMSFEGIGTPTVGRGAGSPPWSDDPGHGRMDEDVAAELSALLAQFTGTPEECYFGVWEGYGQYSGGSAILTSDGRSRRLSTPGDIRRAQRVKGVGRNYLLYAGRLEQIAGFYHKFPPRPPNIWWPADHAWLVATDIDLDSTYVGGTLECIDAILASKALEAVPAHRAASVAITADDINLSDRS